MISRTLVALAACLGVLPSMAQDAPVAAGAAATPPAPTAAVAAAPAPAEAPKPVRSHPKKKAKAVKKNKKPAKWTESKYKTRILSENTEATYRFDAHGNPIKPGAKKSSVSEGQSENSGQKACTAEEPCVERKSGSDAL